MASAEPGRIRIEVVYAPAPSRIDRCDIDLPADSTVADALRVSGVLARHGLALDEVDTGVWCRAAPATQRLRDRDRVELYRPLKVDPKEARRQRYRRR